jgi:hypothetical protein
MTILHHHQRQAHHHDNVANDGLTMSARHNASSLIDGFGNNTNSSSCVSFLAICELQANIMKKKKKKQRKKKNSDL